MDRLLYFLRRPFQLLVVPLSYLPIFKFSRETLDYQNRVPLEHWFYQKVMNIGGNKAAYWPVAPSSQVVSAENIYAGIDTCPGLMKGCYIQGKGGIWIDDYTQIGPNVAIVSANHDPLDLRVHVGEPVVIGKYCWIGANSSVTPGVTLGDFTIVGAGSVVTKSFPDGHCVIAGNPAKKIRALDAGACVQHECRHKYHGFIHSDDFGLYSSKFLRIAEIFSDDESARKS